MTTNDSKRLLDGSTAPRRLDGSTGPRRAWLLILGGLAALGLGCSGGGAGVVPVETTGEVGVSLTLVDGVTISAVSYSITGGPTVLTGTIDVGKSATISATFGPLAAGSNYALNLTAKTSAGAQCAGSAGPFTVTANKATPVSIVLTCPSLHQTGNVAISGKVSVCPGIAAITAAPAEVYVGNDVHLIAVAGPDDQAHGFPLTYSWSGASSSDGAGDAVFHCATAGTYTVGLTVDNGNPECVTTPADPAMTSSITVTCTDDGSSHI